MNDSNRSTQLDDENEASPGAQPAAPQTGKNQRDARDQRDEDDVDEAKLEENRRRLGVNEEHRTAEMEQGKRGTFP